METATVRIEKVTHKKLKEIAQITNKSIIDLIDEITNEYYKKLFWDRVNNAYKILKENKKAWKDELKERALWENTIGDSND